MLGRYDSQVRGKFEAEILNQAGYLIVLTLYVDWISGRDRVYRRLRQIFKRERPQRPRLPLFPCPSSSHHPFIVLFICRRWTDQISSSSFATSPLPTPCKPSHTYR